MTETDRRAQVLAAALTTFSRYGYRKTSMDDVARAAGISRPGLYFLFDAKPQLFRAAVVQALDEDIAAAQLALQDTGRPLPERLIEAFDRWTGRYLGPMTREVAVLMETSPDLLGEVTTEYPRRFLTLITEALAGHPRGADVARTLVSTAAGIKHEAGTREEFAERMTIAVDLLTGQ